MRVALYAEGARELGASAWRASSAARDHVQVGAKLPDRALGAAHHLVARLAKHPVEFIAPLLMHSTGRRPTGSDLLVEKNLIRLTSWPNLREAPDAYVVLVDGDGEAQRRPQLQRAVRDQSPPVVIGVAREAFEAWLLADLQTLRRVLQIQVDDLGDVERLRAQQAKAKLDDLLARANRRGPEAIEGARAHLAAELDLEVVRQRSRSFSDLRSELARVL